MLYRLYIGLKDPANALYRAVKSYIPYPQYASIYNLQSSSNICIIISHTYTHKHLYYVISPPNGMLVYSYCFLMCSHCIAVVVNSIQL